VRRHGNGVRDLSLEDFGVGSGSVFDTRNGEASVYVIDAGSQGFSLNLVHASGTRLTIDYEGRIDGDYDARTAFSGSGTVTREGEAPTGTVEVTTTDEVLDNDVCGQPASGNTAITDDAGNTVVVTYDGSVDCDGDQAASYTLNGVAQGKLTGIACSTSPGQTGHARTSWLALALAATWLAGRRRAK
jgi:hypothetical protein